MSEAEAECIRISDIQSFVNGTLGQRMKAAALSGLLFREQPFVISRSAAEIDEAWDSQERVLVQGIIDAYFLEGDEIVLVDYKTDRVRRGEEQKLVDLYHTQLEDYAQCTSENDWAEGEGEVYLFLYVEKRDIVRMIACVRRRCVDVARHIHARRRRKEKQKFDKLTLSTPPDTYSSMSHSQVFQTQGDTLPHKANAIL
ncbi:MAG: hypothetical protein ACLTER_22840 [Ruminococcus sp.]